MCSKRACDGLRLRGGVGDDAGKEREGDASDQSMEEGERAAGEGSAAALLPDTQA